MNFEFFDQNEKKKKFLFCAGGFKNKSFLIFKDHRKTLDGNVPFELKIK